MDSISLSSILVIVDFVVLIAGIIGGYMVLRSTLSKDTQSLQERVQTMLKDENGILQDRLERVEEDNRQLKQQLALVIEVMRRQGTILEIDDGMVKVKDAQGSTFMIAAPPEAPKKRSD